MQRYVKVAAIALIALTLLTQLNLTIIFGKISVSVSTGAALGFLGTIGGAGFGTAGYAATRPHYSWWTIAVIVVGLAVGVASFGIG